MQGGLLYCKFGLIATRHKTIIRQILYNMNLRGEKISPFFISVALVLTVTVTVCIFSVSCSLGSLDYSAAYYFLSCYIKDNAISASILSDTVSSYGGAGYVLEYGGSYYVTVACYYTERDAETVCASLKRRQFDCSVIRAEREDFSLNSYSAKANATLYKGNLNTLQSISMLAYECANGLDVGSYSQSAAKGVTADISNGLAGLKSANPQNCFTSELNRLVAECESASDGYIYSKNMRRLQIAVIDCILNIELY